MPNNPYYVFDANKLKAEGMTKEQIYNAIAQATGTTPTHVDEGFISTLIENNRNRSIHIWKGTRAEFNALDSKSPNTLYVVDDDTTLEDLRTTVESMSGTVSAIADNIGTADDAYVIRRKMLNYDIYQTVGTLRVIGKVAFLHVNYIINNFSESATSDTFDLPIKFDIYSHIRLGVTLYSPSTGGYIPARVEIKNTSGTPETIKTTVTITADSNLYEVDFCVCWDI